MTVIIFILSAKKKIWKGLEMVGSRDHWPSTEATRSEGWRLPGTLQQLSRFPEQTPKGFSRRPWCLAPPATGTQFRCLCSSKMVLQIRAQKQRPPRTRQISLPLTPWTSTEGWDPRSPSRRKESLGYTSFWPSTSPRQQPHRTSLKIARVGTCLTLLSWE